MNTDIEKGLNSTMVRLKQIEILKNNNHVLPRLNSTMVRLKRIKTAYVTKDLDCLNSTMVRLKRIKAQINKIFGNQVSIPLWFD